MSTSNETMEVFWDVLIAPLLGALRPKTVVQIGCSNAALSRHFAESCRRRNATLHCIDRAPVIDAQAWKSEFGDCFHFHQDLSLNALPEIGACDFAVINGDHNWYTVFHELEAIGEPCARAARPYPVIVVHEVGWPYGRRDAYYDLAAIPRENRHECSRKGIVPGQPELDESGGVDVGSWKAKRENTPRNGVMTAVGDFVNQSDHDLKLIFIPGFHGLALMVPPERCSPGSHIDVLLASWSLSPATRQFIEQLETTRISLNADLNDIRQKIRRAMLKKSDERPPRPIESASTEPAPLADAAWRDPYIDLMKRCLLNLIYGDPGYVPRSTTQLSDQAARLTGRDWPQKAHTMIGLERLDNIQACLEDVIRNAVPGDLIETGVWRGGATIFMRALLRAWNVTDRNVWVADSFEGLPRPRADVYPDDEGSDLHRYDELAVSLEEVRSNFAKYGLLDDQVRFVKGWFRDSLSSAPIDELAVLRLDGDMYESTIDALTHLYPKLSPGGYVIVDDFWAFTSCRHAVVDYRKMHRISDPIQRIDWTAVYWQRSAE